jgi:acetyltransferase-like isoleucine patch superfamily enzyme
LRKLFQRFFQVVAFFFPSPFNVWLHRLAGAEIGRHVRIHPGVLILARNVCIGEDAIIKFGAMVHVRTFRLGRKSKIGFFTLAKGVSDLLVADACIIGPKCMIECSREVVLDYYSGVGPGSYLYTHGSGMPVTEGYRSTFSPIHIKEKVWVNMRSTIGPGVTIGEKSVVMPGTILLESVGPNRLVAGDPVKLSNVPRFSMPVHKNGMKEIAKKILADYSNWLKEYERIECDLKDSTLLLKNGSGPISITIDGPGDIALLTRKGDESGGAYFNLADLSTDQSRFDMKTCFEEFLRMYFGLIFLSGSCNRIPQESLSISSSHSSSLQAASHFARVDPPPRGFRSDG